MKDLEKQCGLADLMVSYIYDEVGTPERRKFEEHLLSCIDCADEFAEISNARFSIFEWQKEEFAHLATPEIVIPYELQSDAAAQESQAGFWEVISSLLTPAKLSLAATVTMVVLGVGFWSIGYFDQGDLQLATNRIVPVESSSPEIRTAIMDPVRDDPEAATIDPTMSDEAAAKLDPRPVTPVQSRNSKPNRNFTASNPKPKKEDSAPATLRAPRLNNYDDLDDRSLRLADLFDEDIGATR